MDVKQNFCARQPHGSLKTFVQLKTTAPTNVASVVATMAIACH